MNLRLVCEPTEYEDFWISSCSAPDIVTDATVVIPTFRAEATLAQAIRSVLEQTLRNIEVIVIDDASTDNSWNIILEFLSAEPRVRAIRHKTNSGKALAINRATSFVKGRWLAVLDADDWYDPRRLSSLIAIGDRFGADLVADNQFFYDAVANTVVGTAWPSNKTEWELTFDDFLIGSNAYDTFNLGMLKPVLRTDFVRSSGLDYEKQARHGQDFLYLLQFYLLGGKAVVTDAPYYFYTQPYGAVSRRLSYAARKRYDFRTAAVMNRRYLDTAVGQATDSQLAHLRSRCHRLRTLEHYYLAKELFEQGRMLAAAAQAVRHPELMDYAFRRLLLRAGLSFEPAATRVARRARERDQTRFSMMSGAVSEN